MAVPAAPPRVDERALGAGTTVRFVLLLVLLLVSSGSMMQFAADRLSVKPGYACLLAAGGDPNEGGDHATAVRAAHHDAYQACVDRYEPAAPWWLNLVWPVLVVAVAVVLFRCLPAWKARRGRTVPLETIDHDGGIGRRVAELAAVAGLTRIPRIVVDPAAASTGAVVFGSNRRPTVRLHGGLLVRRTTDPEGFRAVLLHEFAHIRNGDVTLTYATVAVWRVFVALVILPYVTWYLVALPAAVRSPFWRGEAPFVTRGLLLPLIMIVLVHLARSDVLRSRELYADLAAVRWGADPRGWAVAAAGPAGGTLRRVWGAFAELWRTHPRWDLRREALDDPAALFGVQALPMFLTGVAALLIDAQAWSGPGSSGAGGYWSHRAVAVAAAGLATGVAGIALWRAVAHAVLTGRRVPSGVRAGLWLGAGAAAGELIMNRAALLVWFPANPEVLVLVLCAGAAFAWWTAQSAQLWVRAWPGRTIRPAMLLGLAAAGLVLSSWFVWWQAHGVLMVSGWPYDTAGLRQVLAEDFAASPSDHPAMQTAIARVWPVLSGLDRPLVLSAVVALWALPLLAWTLRPAGMPPRWARDALGLAAGEAAAPGRELPPQLPPLRRLLPVVLLGVPACWAAVAAVMAYMHTWQPPPGQRGGLFALIDEVWSLVALVAVSAAAAVAASVPATRFRLLVALIAAETVALGGLAGRFVLAATDGCLPSLNTMATTCHWRPDPAWTLTRMFLGYVLVLAAFAAVMAAAAVSAAGRVRRFREARRAGASREAGGAPARGPASEPPPGPVRGGLAGRRICVAVVCAVAVAATAAAAREQGSPGQQATADVSRVVPAAGRTAVSARIKQLQVDAWWGHGGWELAQRFSTATGRLSASLMDAARKGHGDIDPSVFRPLCDGIGRIAQDAGRYFPVPDPGAQASWQSFITWADRAGRDCRQGLDQEEGKLFIASMNEFSRAGGAVAAVASRITEVRRGDGR
ncbi:M48 family metallopeptidase [Streptomyces sp. NPDC008001]|uniref:M48 family metallopeptidase n=1 Tax=Streptomyces sp. NPDC008001 TaxID=3364804 RepID=UPI0036EAA98F